MINVQQFQLDITQQPLTHLKVVNGDTANQFVIKITNDGESVSIDSTLHKIVAVFHRADGQVYTQDADSGVTFTTAGVVTVDVLPSSFRTGTNTITLQIYKRESSSDELYPLLATTNSAAFYARASAIPNETPSAQNPYPSLEKYVAEAASYAHGGTGVRTGENTDNAKYYKEIAEQAVQGGIVDPTIDAWLDDHSAHIDGVITDEVDEWLDAHPEATTTVQDGAITLAKLNSNVVNEFTKIQNALSVKPAASAYENGRLNPSTGSTASSAGYIKIDGVDTTRYAIRSKTYVNIDMLAVIGVGTAYPVVFAWDSSDNYIGFYANGSFSQSGIAVISNDRSINVALLKKTYPTYKFRIVVYDSSATSATPDVSTLLNSVMYMYQTIKMDDVDAHISQASASLHSTVTEELMRYIKGSFSTDEFEVGRYAPTTADISSSSCTVDIGDGVEHTVYGIRSSHYNDMGFVRAIDVVESSGYVYMYLVAFNTFTSEVDGIYNPNTDTFKRSAIKAPVVQRLDVAKIQELHPNHLFKLCVVNVSTESQITVVETLPYLTCYYAPSRDILVDTESKIGVVPDYYKAHLDSKIANILSNMEDAGRNGFTFAFITDPHWDHNCRLSPALMRYIMDRVHVNNVICGGDLYGEGTKTYAEEMSLDFINAFKRVGITFPVAIGNHDRNWNTANNQRDHSERKLTDADVYALIEAQYDKRAPVYFGDDGMSFYVDYPETNTRVIVIDTGDTRTLDGSTGIFWTEYEDFADVLMSSGSKNIIVVAHAIAQNNIGTRICRISTGYNNRAEYSTSYLTYDFSSAQGHVYLAIGGHGHEDSIVKPESSDISYVMTDCDALITNADGGATPGTVSAQAFDIVTVNYTTGGVKLVRIGRGDDREIEGAEE